MSEDEKINNAKTGLMDSEIPFNCANYDGETVPRAGRKAYENSAKIKKGQTLLGACRAESDAATTGGMASVWRARRLFWGEDPAMNGPKAGPHLGERQKRILPSNSKRGSPSAFILKSSAAISYTHLYVYHF